METKIETSRLYEIKEARKLRQETALVFLERAYIMCPRKKRKTKKQKRKKKAKKGNNQKKEIEKV